jgi:hypothetical protein
MVIKREKKGRAGRKFCLTEESRWMVESQKVAKRGSSPSESVSACVSATLSPSFFAWCFGAPVCNDHPVARVTKHKPQLNKTVLWKL